MYAQPIQTAINQPATFPRYRCLFKAGKAGGGEKEGACLIPNVDAGK